MDNYENNASYEQEVDFSEVVAKLPFARGISQETIDEVNKLIPKLTAIMDSEDPSEMFNLLKKDPSVIINSIFMLTKIGANAVASGKTKVDWSVIPPLDTMLLVFIISSKDEDWESFYSSVLSHLIEAMQRAEDEDKQ